MMTGEIRNQPNASCAYNIHVSGWAKRKFVFAVLAFLLEGVLGLLSRAVFDGIAEVLMKLLNIKFGVWWGAAVLWGPDTLSIRRLQDLMLEANPSRDTAKVQVLPPTPILKC